VIRESLLHDIIEGRMTGEDTQNGKRMHVLSHLKKGNYVALKRAAEDWKEWQKLLRTRSHTAACRLIA